jgi:hypothetical protein
MFSFDRDTATIVAVVMCVAATVYLFRELKRTREELSSAIAEKQQPVIYMEPPPAVKAAPVPETTPEPAPAPAPTPKPSTTRGKKQVTIVEPESDK